MSTSTHTATSPTRFRYVVLSLACALSVITYLDRICISQVQDKIKGSLSLTDLQMGMVFSAFMLGYTLFEVPGGWMGDRWGSRRVLTRIVLWWSLFTALTGAVFAFELDLGRALFGSSWVVHLGGQQITLLVLNGFLVLLLVRFLFGCGEAGAYPNLARVTAMWMPFRERAFAQGAIWTCARLGGAIAPVVIIALSDTIGWRLGFVVLGVVGVIWCLAFLWWFRDRPEDHPSCNAAELQLIREGKSPHDGAHGQVPWRTMLRSWNLWAVCLASFGVSFGWYFYPTWQPKFLDEVHHISYRDSKFMTGLPFLFGAAGCLIGGRLSDRFARTRGRRWGRSILGLGGFTGAGLCVLATGFVTEPWQAVALLCLAFFINDLAIPALWAVSADIGGRHAGTVAGFMNMIGAVGGMISPLLIPYLIGALPQDWTPAVRWQAVFAVLSIAWFVAALAWLRIDASKPLFPADPPAQETPS